jgi:hypothetical protein
MSEQRDPSEVRSATDILDQWIAARRGELVALVRDLVG